MAGKGFRRQPGIVCENIKRCLRLCCPIRLAQHVTVHADAGGLLDVVHSHPVWAETPAGCTSPNSNGHDVQTAACSPHTS